MKKSLSAYVIFSIAILLAYTIAEFYSTDTTGITHDTLTTCFFCGVRRRNSFLRADPNFQAKESREKAGL